MKKQANILIWRAGGRGGRSRVQIRAVTQKESSPGPAADYLIATYLLSQWHSLKGAGSQGADLQSPVTAVSGCHAV